MVDRAVMVNRALMVDRTQIETLMHYLSDIR